jgi:peptide/nickel transport system substrate-binding protein
VASFIVLGIVLVIAVGALGYGLSQRGSGSKLPVPTIVVSNPNNPSTAVLPSPTPTKVKIPIRGGRYTEAVVGGVPAAINPLLPDTITDPNVTSLIFSGLTKLDGNGNVYGDLADKIDLDPLGKQYTFHIRDSATWHDGQPVTPQDVLFTIKLIQDPHFPGDPALADFWRTVNVELPGGNQVRFTLADRYSPFLSYTTIGLLPQHLLGGIKAEELRDLPFNLQPVGAGPYRFVNLDPNGPAVNLTLWTKHYQVATESAYFVQELRFQYYPSFDAALAVTQQAKQSGVMGLAEIPITDLGKAATALNVTEKDPQWRFYGYNIAAYTALFFNFQSPIFSDRAVRQAASFAIDRDFIVRNALSGQALPGDGPIHPSSWAYKDEKAKHPYDTDQAKQTLDTAGWKAGPDGVRVKDGQRLTFTLVTNSSGERPLVAQMVAKQLQAVGFDVQVNATALSSFDLQQTYLEPHRFDAAIFGWDKLLGDPDPYLLWHSTQADSGYNFSDFRDSDADQLLENGRRATNPAERKILYSQFQDLFASETPAVVLYYPRYVVAVSTKLNGVNVDTIDTPADRFRGISQWFMQYDEKTAAEATDQAQPPAPLSTPQVPQGAPPPAAPPNETPAPAGTGPPVGATATKKP